nr:MAG TPA: hypothetical protein [Caudoviricetes sp.]
MALKYQESKCCKSVSCLIQKRLKNGSFSQIFE